MQGLEEDGRRACWRWGGRKQNKGRIGPWRDKIGGESRHTQMPFPGWRRTTSAGLITHRLFLSAVVPGTEPWQIKRPHLYIKKQTIINHMSLWSSQVVDIAALVCLQDLAEIHVTFNKTWYKLSDHSLRSVSRLPLSLSEFSTYKKYLYYSPYHPVTMHDHDYQAWLLKSKPQLIQWDLHQGKCDRMAD